MERRQQAAAVIFLTDRLMKNSFKLASIAASLAFCVGGAHASLLGSTVSCSSDGFFTGCAPTSAVVGAGVEFDVRTPVPGYHWSVDIGANSVTFTDLSAGSSSGGHGSVTLTGFLDTIIGISGFSTNASYGIEASDIRFGDHSITIDAYNSGWNVGQGLSFTVLTAGGTPGHVPEPGSLALIGLGLAGAGLARRRAAQR